MTKGHVQILALSGIMSLFPSCSKGGGSEEAETKAPTATTAPDDKVTPAGEISLASGMSTTVPKDLAVTSVTERLSQQAMTAGQIGVATALTGGDPGKDYYSKVQRLKSVLVAEDLSDCLAAIPPEFSLPQGNFGHASCAGPSVDFTAHPDGVAHGPGPEIGNGELGMFWDYADVKATSGEACSARVANNLMANVAGYSDVAVGLQAMVACAARLSAKDLPPVGESVAVTDALADIDVTGRGFTIEAASIAREEDSGEGQAVFLTTVEGELTDMPRSITTAYKIRVRHFRTKEDNSSYRGVVQFELDKLVDASRPGVISIIYAWDGSTISYRYRQAPRPSVGEPFDAVSHELEPGDPGAKWDEVVVNMSATGVGKLAYVGVTSDPFVFNVETKVDGSGAAYFGHNRISNLGKAAFYDIVGLKCLPVNPHPNEANAIASYVQMQALRLNDDNGFWDLESSKIKFAPTVSCAWNSANDPSGAATFSITNQDYPEAGVNLAFPYERNLLDLSSYRAAWVAPEPPSL